MSADIKLEIISGSPTLSSDQFTELILDFEKAYVAKRNYFERIAQYRNPAEVKGEILRQLSDDIISFQNRGKKFGT